MFATSAVARVLSTSVALTGLNSSAQVAVPVDAFWFAQINPDGLCQLLRGCLGATGSGTNWVYRMSIPVPGVGRQTVDRDVRVT